MKSRVLLIMGMLVAFSGAVYSAGYDVGGLSSLASRMLAGLDGPRVHVQLFVGEIAEVDSMVILRDFGDGANVIGSVVRRSVHNDTIIDMTVLLDVPSDPGTAAAAYREEIERQGWRSLFAGKPWASSPETFQVFCTSGAWPYVLLTISELDFGSEVRATTVWSGEFASPCSPSPLVRAFETQDSGNSDIPDLVVPPDVQVIVTRLHPDPYRSYYSVTMQTVLKASALEEHFASQLESNGWKRLLSRSDEKIAWSSWEVSSGGAEMLGVLNIFEESDEAFKTMYLDVIPKRQ